MIEDRKFLLISITEWCSLELKTIELLNMLISEHLIDKANINLLLQY